MRKIKAALAGLLMISWVGLATYPLDNESKQEAAHFLDEHAGEFVSISDAIWSYAELGFQEFKSSEVLAKILKKYGFDVKLGVAGMPTAMVASWGSGHPAIGFLAFRQEGFCPQIIIKSLAMFSFAFSSSITLPMPILTTTFSILGTAILFL